MLYPGLSGGCGRSVCEGSSQSMFRCFGMLGRLTVGTLGSSRSDVQRWPVAFFCTALVCVGSTETRFSVVRSLEVAWARVVFSST